MSEEYDLEKLWLKIRPHIQNQPEGRLRAMDVMVEQCHHAHTKCQLPNCGAPRTDHDDVFVFLASSSTTHRRPIPFGRMLISLCSDHWEELQGKSDHLDTLSGVSIEVKKQVKKLDAVLALNQIRQDGVEELNEIRLALWSLTNPEHDSLSEDDHG